MCRLAAEARRLELWESPEAPLAGVALSIKQPWATLVAHGLKTIEIRSWRSRHVGWFHIHAGLAPERDPAAWAELPDRLRDFAQQRGGVVGRARMTGLKTYECGREFAADQPRHRVPASWYAPPMHGFILTDAEPVPFVPRKGALFFFAL